MTRRPTHIKKTLWMMSSRSLKVGDYHPTQKWNPLELIYIRSKCDVGIIRLENAIQDLEESGQQIKDSQRKNTTELIETLRSAMIALQDLEGERNICNHNSILERVAHTKTMLELEQCHQHIEKLTREGDSLRSSISKFMIDK